MGLSVLGVIAPEQPKLVTLVIFLEFLQWLGLSVFPQSWLFVALHLL
jgi:hypothetical protein